MEVHINHFFWDRTRTKIKEMNDSRNHESSSLPLLYRPLCTRRSSYPKYIILINGGSPIPVRHGVLGHEISSALVNSGRAKDVPPVVDDIAETLCWLLEARSPIPLQCIFNMISSHLLRVCDIRTHHIHPFKAHFKLAAIAGSWQSFPTGWTLNSRNYYHT